MAKTKTHTELETGMLAFSRSIQITEGLFYARNSQAEAVLQPIAVFEKGVRGQTSQDDAKDKAGKSNPQSVEAAVVPQDCNEVVLKFGVRILNEAMKPHSCGSAEVDKRYRELAGFYRDAGGFRVLAVLYVWNVANARFAWRNRFQTDRSTVIVKLADNSSVAFDPSKLDLVAQASEADLQNAAVGDQSALPRLIDGIADALSTSRHFQFDVTWIAEFQPGQEIFPSQEYVRDERQKDDLSRVYAKLPTKYDGKSIDQASMHSQKIGAAIRHIDVWHGDTTYGAIAVNPYGGVQETSAVLRDPKSKKSFYDIRKNYAALHGNLLAAKDGNASISDDAHFFMANLIRGGVYGASGGDKEAA